MRIVMARLILAVGVAALAVVAVGTLAALAPAAQAPETSAFGTGEADAADWADEMAEVHQVKTLVSGTYLVAEASQPTATLLVVHTPTRAPTPDETTALKDHLAAGGSIWVLDPAGAYNPWLTTHGVAVGPHRLVDSASPYGSGTVVVESTAGASEHAVARSPASLVIDEDADWDVWLRAPARVHLDLDGNGTIDRIDTPGPHPVGALLDLASGGRLVVTADASLVSDDMRAVDGARNAEVARHIVQETLGGPGLVLIDESHHGWTESERMPVAAVDAAQRTLGMPAWASWLIAAAAAAAAVALVAVGSALRPYTQHVRSDPVTPPEDEESAAGAGGLVMEAAWELLSLRTRQPVDRLKKTGAAEAAYGLADDAALRRVLTGEASAEDETKVLTDYVETQDPAKKSESEVKP